MIKYPLIFIEHILDAINDIEESIGNFSEKEFKKNKDIKDATIRRIEIIGEAVRNLPDSFKKEYSNIEWREIIGMRDKLIHNYFGVDLEKVWKVVEDEIPKLKKEIKEILKTKQK